MLKKAVFRIAKWGSIALVLLVSGGVGSTLMDRYVVPKLVADHPSLGRWEFFRKATETTTIINRTERIEVQASDSVEAVASQAANAAVNIVSVGQAKTATGKPALSASRSLAGSGVIVTNDGVVVTYRTAILEEDADYTVLLPDGRAYPATLIGIDPLTNLAFLRVDASNLSAVAFSNSDDAHPGKRLIAISNSSEEYQNRYAEGLLTDADKTFNLSEKTVSSSEKWEGVFEMDLASPGKSLGGPVINYNGELVGIVGDASLDSQTSYFLIPANVVRETLDRALGGGFADRPVLGLYYVTITKIYALMHGLDRDRGALVSVPSGRTGLAVIAGSPADRAGIRYGDVIIAVDGREVNLDNPLPALIGRLRKGNMAELLIIRDGKEQSVAVEL